MSSASASKAPRGFRRARAAASILFLIAAIGTLHLWLRDALRTGRPGSVVKETSPSIESLPKEAAGHVVDEPTAPEPASWITSRIPMGQTVAQFHVVNEAGAPIPGAEVRWIRSGEVSILGRSDSEGWLTVRGAALARPGTLRASASTYVPSFRVFEAAEDPNGFEFVLRRAGSIRGIVLFAKLPFPRATVFAVPGIRFPGPSVVVPIIHGALSSDPHLHISHSNEAGEFTFDELDPDGEYSVMAGAPGYATGSPDYFLKSGTDVTLRVRQLFGARVRIRESGGGRLQVDPRLAAVPAPVFTGLNSPEVSGAGSFAVALAGFDPDVLRSTPFEPVIFQQASVAESQVGPLRYLSAFPGYESAAIEFYAKPLVQGLTTYVLELEPERETKFVDVEVSLRRIPPFVRDLGSFFKEAGGSVPLGKIFLERRTREGQTKLYSIDVTEADGSILVKGVPTGSYLAWFQSTAKAFESRRQNVDIDVTGSSVSLDVDTGGYGSIGIVCRAPEGTIYTGALEVELRRVDTDGTREHVGSHRFAAAPYGIPYAPAVPCELRATMFGRIFNRSYAVSKVVEVRPEQLQIVDLTIEEKVDK